MHYNVQALTHTHSSALQASRIQSVNVGHNSKHTAAAVPSMHYLVLVVKILQYHESKHCTNGTVPCFSCCSPLPQVTLYQDARAEQCDLVDQLGYTRARAFDDILAAIQGARDFIYITGWSVKSDTSLEREGEKQPIGEFRNRPDQEILVPDWLIASHVT